MRKVKGFTLVELLVVLSIIAVLSTVAIASYTSFLKNARDTKRKADLNFIQSALEQYHADQKYYPAAIAPAENCQGYKDGWLMLRCPLKSPDGGKVYLSEVPTDPLPDRVYCYEILECDWTDSLKPKCKGYNLLARLESVDETTMRCYGGNTDFNIKVTTP